MSRSRTSEVPFGLVLVRIVTGSLVALQGWHWVKDESLPGSAIRSIISDATAELPVPIAWWGDQVLLANADATALFWRWGTFLLGAALAIGGLVRTAGLLGLFLLAHGLVFGPEEDTRIFLLLAACVFACASAGAGRRLGMDALVEDRLPSWLTLGKKSSSTFLG